jgi:hypothetical protein
MHSNPWTRVFAGAQVNAGSTLPFDHEEIDLWDAWAMAAIEASVTLHSWLSAERTDSGETYAVYVAALDREEQAARALGMRIAAAPAVAA